MYNIQDGYGEIEVSSEVMSASSHKLIQLLMNKCLQQIQLAKVNMTANEMRNVMQLLKNQQILLNI